MYFPSANRYMGNQYRSNEPLTDEIIRRAAPSIFADEAHESRSDRYAMISTNTVLDGLRKEGFQPFMVMQTKVRDDDQRDHAKHMIRLRHVDQRQGEEWNEIVLVNSHNGTSSYQMFGGIYRQICSNGMVCGDNFAEVRIPHKGSVTDRVVEGAHTILDGFGLITEHKEDMKALKLDQAEQEAFASAALLLRFDDPAVPPPITEQQILRARRSADASNDLWTTFNRVQENLVKGGQRGRSAKGKPMTTRAVTGLDSDVRLNRALWTLSEKMRELKG